MEKKKKLDYYTKSKLLIQGEYLLIAIVFLVLAILRLVGVISINEIRSRIFIFITTAGSCWIIFDFFWSTFSKKHRAKVTYLDKIIMFPVGLGILTYDFISLIRWSNSEEWYRIGIAIIFLVIFCVYTFQAIYHWFYPTKAFLAAVEADLKEKEDSKKENEENEKGDGE